VPAHSRPPRSARSRRLVAADRSGHVILMGLEVTDHASYARYRARMTPILESHGGFEPAVARGFVLAEL
jgi:hypothetical protein